MEGRLYLKPTHFSSAETVLVESGSLKAVTFTYSTGVHAVRLESGRGHIVVLPYQGQQIWDAVFDGRRLTMNSYFSEPVASRNLFDSYGAFLYHCGALRMGTPGPEDDHPVHGELPAAPYSEAWVVIGEDDRGKYLGLSGSFNYIRAFGDKYRAQPLARLYEGSTLVDVSMTIENQAHYPMDLMYMCHVNYLPAENGEIIQPTGWGTDDMIIRSVIPGHVHPTPEYLELLESLKKDPGVLRTFKAGQEYSPEIVFYVKNLRSDPNGWTHMIQKHQDGTADYVSYDVGDLDHTVRWILKHKDQQVNGMALPATCDPEGYTNEKKKGNVRSLDALSTKSFAVRVGYLDQRSTVEMERTIQSLR